MNRLLTNVYCGAAPPEAPRGRPLVMSDVNGTRYTCYLPEDAVEAMPESSPTLVRNVTPLRTCLARVPRHRLSPTRCAPLCTGGRTGTGGCQDARGTVGRTE